MQNSWGGPDSSDKRDWFAGAIVDLFPEFTDSTPAKPVSKAASNVQEEPDVEDIESVLLQVMIDEFEVNVDDDSAMELAQQILRARSQCAHGQFDEANKLQERYKNRDGKRVDAIFKRIEDDDGDSAWSSEESSEDDDQGGAEVVMDEAPQLIPVSREKSPPQVDEEGFTRVTKKKR